MKTKSMILLFIVLLTSLLFVMPVAAYYDDIYGVVFDSKTHAPWSWGGTVAVWDCASYDGTSPAFATGSISTFTGEIEIDPFTSTATALCVQITFDPGTDGTPAPKFFFALSNGQSGTWDLGTIYTDTGPNAVTLSSVQSKSMSMWPMFAMVAAVAVVPSSLLKRKKKAQ